MTKHKCKKCRGNGNIFVKNDYADRASTRTHHHKGKVGHWIKCPKCKGGKYD